MKSEWKGSEISAKSMDKGLYKFFRDVVNELYNSLPTLVKSGSEVSHFIPEPRKFPEVTRLPADVKKSWLKATLKEIKNLIKNQTFLIFDPEKGDSVTPYMDAYKEKILFDGSPDKLKLIIIVRG